VKAPLKLVDEEGRRLDGRRADELRPVKLEVGIIGNASGSAYIELGKNKIIAAVYGPRELHPKHLSLPDRAVIRCRYRMAPFSTDERKSTFFTRRELEISRVIRESIESVTLSELYPRVSIDIFVEVLQADGSTRCASLTAASLALADAGVPTRDLIAACSVGKIDGQIVLDLNGLEDQYGEADMPVALLPHLNELALLQLNGSFSPNELDEALKLAIDGCKRVYELQKETLKSKFKVVEEESV
jgi:exosome complex component RRP41